jgi:wee1-like protein kinase
MSPLYRFNHLQANINPFTPTNSLNNLNNINNSNTSASNAAEMVKKAAAAAAIHSSNTDLVDTLQQQQPEVIPAEPTTPSVAGAASIQPLKHLSNDSTPLSQAVSSRNHLNSLKRPFNDTINQFKPIQTNEQQLTIDQQSNDSNNESILATVLSTSTSFIDTNETPQNQQLPIESKKTPQQQQQQHHNESTCSRSNKRLALRQCLVSRYHEEFHEVCKLGSGEFGDVFKCINRLDGCTYAIKRSKKAIAGSALEISAWKEVCAHAVLVKHNHIVHYYSAWAEADRMLIQNEYCNGGSLAEFIESLRLNNNKVLTSSTQLSPASSSLNKLYLIESDLKILLLHIAKGLAYMHSLNLVHLDIKPGNIFICRSPRRVAINTNNIKGQQLPINDPSLLLLNDLESGIESEECDDDSDEDGSETVLNRMSHQQSESSIFGNSEVITFKIGDLGHVTSTLDAHVEEGDCRYLPNEILHEQYDHLNKADVFALALTVYVSGSLEELPKNGDEWHWIRSGNMKDLKQCSDKFKKLLLQMIDENPVLRPNASTLVHNPCICPDAGKSKAQLRKELNQEKFKNEILQQKVRKYEEALSTATTTPTATTSLNNHQQHQLHQAQISVNNNNKFSRSLSFSFY